MTVLSPRATPEAPGPAAPSLATIICGYTPRRLEQLLAGAAAARAQSGPGDEVLVVIDHHPDLGAAVRARVAPGVRVLDSTAEPGLAGARNSGWTATGADVVVFLDDDALLRPGSLDALRARLADEGVVVVGGAVHPAWEHGGAPRWFPAEFGWVVGCDYTGLPAHGGSIRNPIGAAMAVRRDALAEVGGFSTDLGRVGTLPVGCEETLMGIQVRRHRPGSRSVRDERFAVDHVVPADRQRVSYFVRRCFHEGRSKALVSQAVGAGDGLSSERTYVTRTLPRAVVREVTGALRGDRWGAARAGLVVTGLVTTAVGLVSVRRAPGAAAEPRPVEPVADDELVSVVVCTLGKEPRLVATVRSVLAQTHAELDVVVVDNDPASGRVPALLADLDDPRLRIVDQPVRGLSAARNAGLAAVRGALIAYTDDDAFAEPQWIERLLDVLRDDTTGVVTCVTGRVIAAPTTTVEQEWFEAAGIFDKGTERTTWALGPAPAALGVPGKRSAFFPYTAGEMGSGNNMVFRTAALRALGGFDEALGAGTLAKGGEDLDIYRRAVLAGQVLVYTPDAVVLHHHRETYAALRDQMYGYGVGMAAVLTKILLGGGRPALAVVRCLPRGVYTLLAPGSTKNVKKPAEMPSALVGVELLGYLAGPLAYLRSAAAVRARRRGAE